MFRFLLYVLGIHLVASQHAQGYFQKIDEFVKLTSHIQSLQNVGPDVSYVKEKQYKVDQDRVLSVLETVFAEVNTTDVDSGCYQSVITTVFAAINLVKDVATNNQRAAEYFWAAALLDAQGDRQPRGALLGDHWDLGNYHACKRLGQLAPYEGMYCAAAINEKYMGFVPLVMYRGLCLPSTCNDVEVNLLLRFATALHYTLLHQSVTLDVQLARDLSNLTMDILRFNNPNNTLNFTNIIHDIEHDIENIEQYNIKTFGIAFSTLVLGQQCHRTLDLSTDAAAIAVICLLSFFGMFMLLGTLYDYFSYQNAIAHLPDKRKEDAMNDHNSTVTKKDYYDNLPLLLKCIMAFSVYTNFPKIFDTTRREGTLDCIHGVRFMSMTWVILGHVYVFSLTYIDNPVMAYETLGSFLFQALGNATLSVDTFFLLSGLLLAYLWFKETEKKSGKNIRSCMHWMMYYLHRFIRLTPVYMLIIGVNTTVTKYFSDGPFWTQTGWDPNCVNYWWRNLLYIQNFFDSSEMCLGVTWYLANDMQFYVIAPIFLVVSYFWPVIGLSLGLAIIMGSALGRGYISGNNNLMPMGGLVKNPDEFSTSPVYFDTIYDKPWMRIGPYVVGIIVGYLLFKALKRGKSFKINKWINFMAWLMAAGLAITVLYGMFDVFGQGEHLPKWANGLYTGVSRTAWAVAVGWVCFACCTGHGGIINSILSWSAWVPLSRLTYCAYLTHLTIIFMYFGNMTIPLRFDGQMTLIYNYFGTLIAAYSVSLVFSLMLEAPVLTLEKLLLPVGGRRPRSTVSPKSQHQKNDQFTSEHMTQVTMITVTKPNGLPNGVHNRNYSTSSTSTMPERVIQGTEPVQAQNNGIAF